MKVLSLFDGISCGMVALERAKIPIDKYVAYEIDKDAIKVSQYNYPQIVHQGDVFEAKYNKNEFNLLIGGSPCFVAGTMIRTIDGFKPIEDIKVGDKVLTHKNRFKTVTTIMNRVAPSTVIVKAENCGEIECTKEHPFYTKEMNRVFNNDKRCYERILSDNFDWTAPEHFIKNINTSNSIKQHTYLTSVTDDVKRVVEYNGVDIHTNQTSTKHVNNLSINDEHLWYIIGRWLGDGWYNYKYTKKKKLSGIKICCGKHEVDELEEKLKLASLHYYKSEEKTTYKFTINNLELALYLQKFGSGATNKHLSSETYYLPDNLALSFLEGYFDADGHIQDDIGSFATASKELAYGIKYMINKYMNTSCSVVEKQNHSTNIEGRKVNVGKIYTGTFYFNKQKQSHFFVEDSYILAPYKSVIYLNEPKIVYNMSVEEDESYVANGLVVHNCTYWSIARSDGNRETTSSGFGWELFMQYVRALKESEPKYFLYENNNSMSSLIRKEITKQLGVEPIMIDSGLVSAQNRKRLYWTNIPNVVQPNDKGLYIKDIIEIRDDYTYIPKEKLNNQTMRKNYLQWDVYGKGHKSQDQRAYFLDGKCGTLDKGCAHKHKLLVAKDTVREFTQTELERLQTLPDGYTKCLSKSAAGKVIGNGWTVDVIAHILSFLKDLDI